MKVVILCGGRGERLGEHGVQVPKALIDIGGRPVIWHLLKLYEHHGLKDFILCLGYLGDQIKRYFLDHHWLHSDLTLETDDSGAVQLHKHRVGAEQWRVTLADTGLDTNTGGRIQRIQPYLGDDDVFCVTYGDGLADIDLRALINFHRAHGRIGTLTAVQPRSSFGLIKLDADGAVTAFEEKPVLKEWINGGFFVFHRRLFEFLEEDSVLEKAPLERLARERQLMAYRHAGFWKCMDTYKDNVELNELWDAGAAAWKVW